MTKNFTKKAKEALESARAHAERLGHTYIGSEHILLGLICTECVASKLLDDKKVQYTDLCDSVVQMAGRGADSPLLYCSFTPKCKKILETASVFVSKFNGSFIGTEHILYALCDSSDCVGARILASLGINLQGLKNEISSFLEMGADVSPSSKGGVAGAPTLSQYGTNLTSLAALGRLDPVWERDKELDRVIQILSRRTKNNPCLIGEPGVGKTAIAEGLALRIASGNAPECLSDKIIVSLDLASMVAGAKYRGEFEERMRSALNELKSNPRIILFIDEIHTIVGAGSAEGAVDAANLIKPFLARGNARVIGATTFDEYRKYIERDPALERRFQPVTVNEPDEEQTERIIKGLKDRYEAHHTVKIDKEAILSAVKLSKRYITDRFLPDKAIDLIDEACARKRSSHTEKSPEIQRLEEKIRRLRKQKEEAILSEGFELASEIRDEEMSCKIALNRLKAEYYSRLSPVPTVTREDIEGTVAAWTGIPVSDLKDGERDRLICLEEKLNKVIIGQRDAVALTVSAVKRGRLGLKNPERPICSFLYLGPTGVGKTALALALAKEVFPGRDSLIRLDMSEYAESHSVSKLIGSPPGYVGFGDGGALTDKIRKNPYTVVLFDEIEKAHRDIYSLLLQILDDGALTDSRSRRVDFRNCIIILTSNLGASAITEPKRFGFYEKTDTESAKSVKKEVSSTLKSHFPPEFLNRLDEIIIFNKLTEADASEICSSLLEKTRERVLSLGIDMTFGREVSEHIASIGYNKLYGVRPLARAITSQIEAPLSDLMLTGEIRRGDSVRLSVQGGAISFDKEPREDKL